ncbi:MAG: hypothetical protein KKF56_05110 [Nanoarchaeota archaeon]|nr:hypothetical protein [Nanoarchaeota archaeon]
MATKDWKKVYEGSSAIAYASQDREIEITKTVFGNSGQFAPKSKDKWSVFKFVNNKPVSIMKDKSKSQALAYARQYMRTH